MPVLTTPSSWSELGRLLVFEIAFYFAYRYGMAFPQDYPAPFWFPDSALLCALLLRPRNRWWMYLLAPLPIRFLLFVPAGAQFSFLIACFVNDSLKALFAAWLLKRVSETGTWFERVSKFTPYFLVAVLLVPLLSAFAGAATNAAMRGANFWDAFQRWFLGNALANLALTPGAFCLVRDFHELRRAKPARLVEASALAAGMFLSTYWAFYLEPSSPRYPPFLLYLHVPFVLWGALRFGTLGACGTLSVVSALAVIGTLAGRGPFSVYTARTSIFEIQVFLCTLAIPFLSLAVLFRERRDARRQLNELKKKLGVVREADRHRIGLELHDDLGQRLVVLSWGLDTLAQKLKSDAGLASEVRKLRALATDISDNVVRLSHELRPETLANLGLRAALQSLCDQAMGTSGTSVKFAQHDEPHPMPAGQSVREATGSERDVDVELALYRVAQEALQNALKHSQSANISIGLSQATTALHLTVTDDGCGFDVSSRYGLATLGLAGMAERMENARGTLRVVSIPGGGTTVTASVPVPSTARRTVPTWDGVEAGGALGSRNGCQSLEKILDKLNSLR